MRIRCYKTVKVKNYFSSWSQTKSISTKSKAVDDNSPAYKLTYNDVMDKFSIDGKPFSSLTPDSLRDVISREADDAYDGVLAGGIHSKVYERRSYLQGYYVPNGWDSSNKRSYKQSALICGQSAAECWLLCEK